MSRVSAEGGSAPGGQFADGLTAYDLRSLRSVNHLLIEGGRIMSSGENRRRNYFIKKKFQAQFIVKFCGLAALASLVSGGMLLFYVAFKGTVTTAFVNSRLSIVTTADYIMPALIIVSLVTIVLVSAATAIVVMYLSHRIAGALFRIEKDVSEITAGNLTMKIRLRSTDEIAKMADCINEMTDSMRKRFSEIKELSQRIADEADAALAFEEKKDSANAKTALTKLSQAKEELSQAVNFFKVD